MRSVSTDPDHIFMEHAFAEFGRGSDSEGLPIGAVLVHKGEIIGRGRNYGKKTADPTQHAEIVAIRDAAANLSDLGNPEMPAKKFIKKTLKRCTLYTTMEPCPMCAGALLMFRIRRVVICLPDPKWGALGTVGMLRGFSHEIEVIYSDHPDCRALRDMPARDQAAKLAVWEVGRKHSARHAIS